MNKYFFAFFFFVCVFGHAKVFSYKEHLPYAILNGKWENECTIRLDFERLLLDLSKCPVLDKAEGFDLYDKDDFYIGMYYHQKGFQTENIEGGLQYISMRFNLSSTSLFNTVSVKDIRRVKLRNPSWRIDKDYIQCNKQGAIAFDVNHPYYSFVCKKPYECKSGEYAVDDISCERLPSNARRLQEKGFECLKGYDLHKDDDTTYCYKPYNCKKGEYATTLTDCAKLPKNARRLQEFGFECLDGYSLYDDNDTTYCFKPYVCKNGEYATSATDCAKLPKNARRLQEIGFECLYGYNIFSSLDTTYCYKP
ncbi:hypothetical protein [uncultured Fibrobacter sp.]|uniref:hypothetical protein n=1 Tax=uncultured Fibrobacter sp. TaxID=261512 RepID=UPI0025E44969|nr:hypothetical protein [uncultured Fibrobacter sp.]